MEKSKKKFSAISVVLLAVAIIMLLVGGIGGARAALTESDTHVANLEMKNIGVELLENGKTADVLLKDLLGDDESLKIGKDYDELISVQNTGAIDCYVRVSIYKYWTDDEKRVDMDPEYIRLNFSDDWYVESETEERTVLYYTKPLEVGSDPVDVVTKLGVSEEVAVLVSQDSVTDEETGVTTVTNNYKYNKLNLGLKARVDAVQTHNAQDAIKSAWGKDVTVSSDGTLRF